MAIAFVGERLNTTDNDNTSTTFTKNLTSNSSAGNHLLCLFANEDGTPVSISDSVNGAWNVSVTRALNGACAQIQAWIKLTSALTTAGTITFTKAAAGNRPSLVGIWEFSGAADSAFDVGATNAGTGTTMASGTTATTAQANEIIFAFWAMDTDATFTLDATYTALARLGPAAGGSSGGNGHVVDGGYKIVAATGTQAATSTRSAGAVAWTTTIGTYMEAAGGVTIAGPLIGGKLNSGILRGRLAR